MVYRRVPSYLQSATIEVVVELVRAGDEEAFSELVRRFDARVHRTAHSILKNGEDAEDAAQETFLRVWLKMQTFEGQSSFSTWLTSITINVCLMRLRSKRQKPTLSLEDMAENNAAFIPPVDIAPNPEQQTSINEAKRYLYRTINGLPKNLRELAHDQIYGQLAIREVALKRGVSVTAAKSRLHRAKKILLSSISPLNELT